MNRTKPRIRSKVEHTIGVIKRVFGFQKVRFGSDRSAGQPVPRPKEVAVFAAVEAVSAESCSAPHPSSGTVPRPRSLRDASHRSSHDRCRAN